MPSKTQSEKQTDENEDQKTDEQPRGRQQRNRSEAQENGQQRSNGRQPREQPQQPTYYYDPQAAARTGLLHLANSWKEAGGTYQAIAAYMQILNRYPQTGAAAAATEELVDLAVKLEKQCLFYTALGIYQKLERTL